MIVSNLKLCVQIEGVLTCGLDHFQSASTVVPYYPSGVSSDYYNKASPSLPSPRSDRFHMNSATDHNYGYPQTMGTLPEMDGADRDPHELGTDSVDNRRHVH